MLSLKSSRSMVSIFMLDGSVVGVECMEHFCCLDRQLKENTCRSPCKGEACVIPPLQVYETKH